MPATRSRSSTEQPAAEVAAEEVKQVHEEEANGDIVVGNVPVQEESVVKPADSGAVVPEVVETPAAAEEAPVAAEPVVAPVATNGSQEAPVESAATNGSAVAETNGSAVVEANGDVVAEEPEVAADAPVSDAKRKSEVGDGDISAPDSTEVKKQKVAEAEPAAAESADVVTEASA